MKEVEDFMQAYKTSKNKKAVRDQIEVEHMLLKEIHDKIEHEIIKQKEEREKEHMLLKEMHDKIEHEFLKQKEEREKERHQAEQKLWRTQRMMWTAGAVISLVALVISFIINFKSILALL